MKTPFVRRGWSRWTLADCHCGHLGVLVICKLKGMLSRCSRIPLISHLWSCFLCFLFWKHLPAVLIRLHLVSVEKQSIWKSVIQEEERGICILIPKYLKNLIVYLLFTFVFHYRKRFAERTTSCIFFPESLNR